MYYLTLEKFGNKIKFIGFFFIFFLVSCKAQNSPTVNCETKYKFAKKNLNQYYSSNDKSFLKGAIDSLSEISMSCPKIFKSAVRLKITIFVLLEDFDNGIMFVNSLNGNEFDYSYKKDMTLNYFQYLKAEKANDTINLRKYLNDCVLQIQNYINEQIGFSKSIDDEIFYDLFLTKSKIIEKNVLIKEIDSLASKYPAKKEFFIALKDELSGDSKIQFPK